MRLTRFTLRRCLLALALLCALGASLRAATVTWTGAVSTDFETAANWSALPVNDLTADLAEFTAPTANQPRLTASRAVSGLLFSTATGGWTLSAAAPAHALSLGTTGLNATAQISGNNTVAADLVVTGNQSWLVGTGGRLVATGAVRLGALGSPLAAQLIIGSTSSAGEITLDPEVGRTVAVHSNLTSAGALQVNQRLTLGSAGGSSESVNVIQNTASAGLRVGNTGALTIRSGTWRTNDLGSNNSSAFTGTLTIAGGTLATGGARYLGQFNGANATSLTLTGGNLLVTGGGGSVVNAGYLGLGTHGTGTPSGRITFTMAGGTLDVAKGIGTNPPGVSNAALVLGGIANTAVHFNQSGGIVRVGVSAGSDVFTGTPNANSFANLSLGGNNTGNAANLVAYTLAGGSLTVAGTVAGVTSVGGISNFNFLGGTLAAGAFDASAIGSSSSASVTANQTSESVALGTLVNRGGTLAPGGDGFAGRTTLTGNYSVSSGQLLIDLAGTTQANAFQSGTYDFVSISGNATLAGTLALKIAANFTPNATQSFTILSAAGGLNGEFSNVAFGARLASLDGLHTFVVSRVGNTVVLGNHAPVGPPVITAAHQPPAIIEGATIVLSVTTESFTPVTYQWRRDGVILAGATGPALTLVNLGPADEGVYEVTTTNSAGTVTKSFTVRPSAAPPTGREAVDVGASRTFEASAGAASYRWTLDGEDVGTGASFTYTPARRAVGVHWLRVVETYADQTTLSREWAVQVRLPAFTAALSYYVAPTGSDTNAGTLAAPFATLEKARDTLRALSSSQKAGGVTVFLRGGVYRRSATFTLAAQDSGTETAPIQYVAYPGETPILTSSRLITAAQLAPLAASEHARVAPGVNLARLWEIDVTGNARANAFPAVFNEWIIHNSFRSSQNGGLLDLFYQGERQRLSRYPNAHPTDDRLTPNLLLDGVAPGTAITRVTVTNPDGTTTNTYPTTANSYLNFAGLYTPAGGTATAVGGAFVYPAAEAARVARWATALNSGGLWVMGFWRVPWQINGARVSLIDATHRVLAFTTNPSNANEPLVPNGIGDKYSRNSAGLGIGAKKEPWWVVNLLEEIDVPGEWAIDFNRRKIYFLMDRDGAPADGEIELSDAAFNQNFNQLIQLNGVSDVRLEGLTFRRHLGVNVQILGGTRNLIRGCTFTQSGNMAVDINGGTEHGVLSSDFEKLASGGILLRGGSVTIPSGSTVPSAVTPSNHFAVNNRFRSFSEVVRVYQAAIDVGFGGPIGSWSVNPAVAGMRVANNDVRTSPHAGILWHGYQHRIEYNELSDFTRISNDFGGIYRYGPNQDNQTVIRYNHLYSSPVGEGIYNDFDHVRTPIYGNVINLKTPSTAPRGYGIWTNTNNVAGAAVAGIPTALQVFNNIAVNSRSNYSLHSSTGGRIANNVSYRKLASDFLWYRITTNTGTATHSVATSNAATLASGSNPAYASDPGFVDFANDDLRLRPDAQVYRDLPTFTPIPLELSGLYLDATRTTGNRVWKPFVSTQAVTSLGANTATLNGTLTYPQFDANATVRVYWGATDGGDDPAAWAHHASLGLQRAGPLYFTPTNLSPGTRYFYRFLATNSAGDHWAERSNFTTTYPFAPTPAGTASADTAVLPAANAIDGDSATLWRASAATGVLTLSFTTPTRVTRYSITSSTETAARDPRDWLFQGSTDGITWVTLDQQAAQTFASRGETRAYGVANDNRFLHYRLTLTANQGDPSAVALAEFTVAVPLDTPDTTGPVITTPGQIVVSGTATGAVVTFAVSATDAVSGDVPAVANPASGSTFPLGNTTVTVTATDGASNTTTASFVVTVLPPSLPAPWTLRQITPFTGVAAGTASHNSAAGSFTIIGTGGASTGGITGDFWTGNNDSFTYLSQPWTGDGIFTARLASFSTPSDSLAKAGLVFRESTATGSRYSAIYFRGGSGVWHQHKTATSGSSTNVNFFSGSVSRTLPEWIRLVRSGDTFSTFYSEDGTTWTELGVARTNVLSGSALTVGLLVAPRTGNTSATATFDNISFLTPLLAWRQANFGSTAATAQAANSADPDGDGQSNLLEYGLGTAPLTANATSTTTALVEDLLQISFFRARADLTYHVEVSDDLATWNVLATNPGTVGQTVTVSDFVPLTANSPRRFLRIRVETP